MAANIPFARSPAHASGAQLLDYTTKEGQNIYHEAMAPLVDKFDGEPLNLKPFLNHIKDKANQFNWLPMLTYHDMLLTDHYGEITHMEVKEKAVIYLTTSNRTAQNSNQLFHCISHSLMAEAYNKVANKSEHYVLTIDGEQINDGPCFLKAVVDSAFTNTRSSSAIIRTNLTSLNRHMDVLEQNDIMKFNDYIKAPIKLLAAAEETTSDLLINLFKAYKNTKDKQFTTWVTNKANSWKEGTLQLNPNGVELMDCAKNYFKDSKSTGEWLKLTKEENKIIALEAQICKTSHKRDEPPIPRKEKEKKERKQCNGEQEQGKVKWAWKIIPPYEERRQRSSRNEPTTGAQNTQNGSYTSQRNVGRMSKRVARVAMRKKRSSQGTPQTSSSSRPCKLSWNS